MKKLMTKDGQRLHRRVIVKIFHPGGRVEQVRAQAPNGQGFNDAGVDQVLYKIEERLSALYPGDVTFELLQLPNLQFNIVYRPKEDKAA